MTTTYNGSRGPVEIATMNGKHAATAAAKLRREEPSRVAEIDALESHSAKMAAEHEAAGSPPAAGDNDGPAIEDPGKPWEAIKANFDDLLTEAANWADGIDLVNQEQADQVGRLRGMLQQAIGAADDARVAEKKPLDDQIAEIQDRYNFYIAPLKNRQPGTASKALAALGNMLTGWLGKLENERRAREAEAAKVAAAAAAEALAAREMSKASSDLAVVDNAEDALANAEALLRQAKGIAKERVSVGGGDGLRAQTLRTYWIAEIVDRKAALNAYIQRAPDEFVALIQTLADRDARGARQPTAGIVFHERQKV